MSAFAHEMARSITTAQDQLQAARIEGDEYLIDIREAELASLTRLAQDHDLQVTQPRSA